MMNKKAAQLRIEQIAPGDAFSFEAELTETMIDAFAATSGDQSPLHMDDGFAQSRGFTGRVVHGGLLVGLFSRLVGMYVPGEHALMQTISVQFCLPAYAGDQVVVKGLVDQVSPGTRTIVVKAVIEKKSPAAEVLAKAKVQIGFTHP